MAVKPEASALAVKPEASALAVKPKGLKSREKLGSLVKTLLETLRDPSAANALSG